MSSREYATPLRLDLRPSAKLRLLLLSAVAAGASGIVLSGLPFVAKLTTATLFGAGIASFTRQHFAQTRRSLVWFEGTRWNVDGTDNLQLAPYFSLSSFLVILPLQESTHRHFIVLLTDSLPTDKLRKLRIRLRLLRTRRC